MRFQKLHLQYYSGFENYTLSFPQEEHDFHIIYGPNEAGKSTVLRSIRDFLFGFPTRTQGEDWKYKRALLRIYASITHNNQTLTGWRRNTFSTRPSLFQEDDETPFQSSFLKQALSSLDRRSFENSWSLDHLRLRSGGEEMIKFNSIEQAFFSNDFGIKNLKAILDDLTREKDTYWATDSRKKTHLKELIKQHADKKKELHQDTNTPEHIQKIKNSVQKAQDKYDNLVSRKDELTDTQSKNTDRHSLVSPYHQFNDAKTTYEKCSQPLFDASEIKIIRSSIEQKRTLDTSLIEQTSLLETYDYDLKLLKPRSSILQEQESIMLLKKEEQDCHDNAPKRDERNKKITHLIEQKNDLLTELNLPSDSQFPSSSTLKQLTPLALKSQEIDTRLNDRQCTLASLKKTCPPRPQKPDLTHYDTLKEWLDGARSDKECDDELSKIKLSLNEQQTEIDFALKRLSPWSSHPDNAYDHLQCLVLPSEEECLNTQKELDHYKDKLERVSSDLLSAQKNLDLTTSKYNQITRNHHWVSDKDLIDARLERDKTIDNIDTKELSSSYWDDLKKHVKHTDSLADQRLQSALYSAQLTELDATKERYLTESDHAQKKSQNLEEKFSRTQQRWEERLTHARLPLLSPHQYAAWRHHYYSAIESYKKLSSIKTQYASLILKKNTRISRLKEIISFEEEDSFIKIYDQANNSYEKLSEKKKTYDNAYQHYILSKDSITESEKEYYYAVEEKKQWFTNWQDKAKHCGYPETLSANDLSLYEELSRIQNEITTLSDQKKEEEDKINSITVKRKQLLSSYNVFSIPELMLKLNKAQKEEETRKDLNSKYQASNLQIKQFNSKLDDILEELSPFIERLSPTKTLDTLLNQITLDEETIRLENEYILRKNQLISVGRGKSLEEICADIGMLDQEKLDKESSKLTTDIECIQKEITSAHIELNEAKKTLKDLKEKDSAVALTEDIQFLQDSIEHEARIYISLHTQYELLNHMIAQQREQAHGPLLNRAGEFFRRLTLGQYKKLITEEDKKGDLQLMALRVEGNTLITIHEMSEGTRDQLFLSLRLAFIHQKIDHNVVLPFLADDLFITFDDERAQVGLELLKELSNRTQVLFFTHHNTLKNQQHVNNVLTLS